MLVFTAAICVSCGGGRKKNAPAADETDAVGVLAPVDENGLVTIDVSADYPEQEIRLQDVADVEYVPLAMSDKVLLSPSDMIFYLSDSYIMVGSRETGEICVFDRTGKIVSHFNRMGRGPGEYMSSNGGVIFDEKAEEFFVFDSWGLTPKIIVYTLDGKHQRTFPLPKWWTGSMYNFDSNSLLLYDTSGIDSGEKYSATPYSLISKADGSVIDTLAIELPERYSNIITSTTQVGNEVVSSSMMVIALSNNRMGGKDFTLADLSADTVYRFTRERILTPSFIRTPSVRASGLRTVWSAELVTEKFIVFSIVPLVFKEGKIDGRSLMYDYTTGRISEVSFFDGNNTNKQWSTSVEETNRPVNTEVSMLNPLRLVEAREKGELSGPLAEIAATIKEDANPVVMIVKFK
jgi:hypothetical protein